MIAPPMPSRFCPQCGTAAVPKAKFCMECGTSLDGFRPAAGPDGWRLTTSGSVALGGLLLGGLAIWTAILSPEPPRPGPGAGRVAAAPPTVAAGGEMPPDHPAVTLPQEAKTLLDGIAARAKEQPKDKDAWLRYAQASYRAGQIDPAYLAQALTAYQHVVELAPGDTEAIRGLANVRYDQNEPQLAIPLYEKFLALKPDDLGARTDLATMYFYAGQASRAMAVYEDVLKRDPKFIQAHVNLGVTKHQQGDDKGALASLTTARDLATDEEMRKRIDSMIAGLGVAPAGGGTATASAPAPAGKGGSPFQSAVESAFKMHPIMGPRIVGFEWTGPGAGRVLVADFPMDNMPPAMRDKFTTRLGDTLRTARTENPIDGPVSVEIADAASKRVMVTVTP